MTMTKKNFLFMLAMAIMLPLQQLKADPILLTFQVRFGDHNSNGGHHRSPVQTPSISLEDYTLYFDTLCEGSELRLIDEEGEEIYSTIIPSSCFSIALPDNLEGEYELQIIQGDICFYTVIYF